MISRIAALAAVVTTAVDAPFEAMGSEAAGWSHSVVLDGDGGLRAWGEGKWGQLGNGDFENHDQPVAVLAPDGEGPLTGVVSVAAGLFHTLALCEDGSVWAWGANTFGQLGNGTWGLDAHSALPVRVIGPGGEGHLEGVVAVFGGWDHSVALLEDGTVLAWGSRCHGQLGDGVRDSTQWSPHPVPVLAPDGAAPLDAVTALACGAHHTVALREDGTLVAWGSNHEGQLGRGHLGNLDNHLVLTHLDTGETVTIGARDDRRHATALPAPVTGPEEGALDGVTSVAAGVYHSVALREDGTVWSWGYNGTGQLGHGTRESTGGSQDLYSATPTPMIGGAQGGSHLTGITAIATGYETTYALDEQGRGWACGWNIYGGLGRGVGPIDSYNAGRMQRISLIVDGELVQAEGLQRIIAGGYHALAIDADGALLGWGHNGFGQLGDSTRQDRFTPTPAGLPADDAEAFAAREPVVGPAPPSPAVAPHFAEPDPEDPGVLDVRDHGAKADGVHLDQQALQATIDAAHEAGGGTVLVPAGVYRTGTLELKSGVRLHLAEGATLLGSTNRDHYEPRALIHAEGAQGIAITGTGTLDGRGCFAANRGWRHNIIRMDHCDDVTVEGVATNNAGSWTQHYLRCTNLTLRNLRLNSVRPGRNNDGLDLTGCEDVLIEGCVVASDDDCIVIKSNSAEHVNRNIRVVNNVIYAFASGFKLGTETRSHFENIECDGLQAFGGTTLALYTVDGSNTRNVRVTNVRAEASRCPLGIRLGARLRPEYFAEDEERVTGSLDDVVVRDIDIATAFVPWRDVLLAHGIENAELAHQLRVRLVETSFISGLEDHPVRNVLLENIRITHPGGGTEAEAQVEVPERPDAYPAAGMFRTLPAWGLYLRHAEDVTLRNITLELENMDGRPPLVNENLSEDDLTIDGISVIEAWR